MKASIVFNKYYESKGGTPESCQFPAGGNGPFQAEVVVVPRRGTCLPRRSSSDGPLEAELDRFCAAWSCGAVPAACTESAFDRATYVYSKYWAVKVLDATATCSFGGTAATYKAPLFAGPDKGEAARKRMFQNRPRHRVSKAECIFDVNFDGHAVERGKLEL